MRRSAEMDVFALWRVAVRLLALFLCASPWLPSPGLLVLAQQQSSDPTPLLYQPVIVAACLTVDSITGHLYVCDSTNARVVEFDASHTYVRQFMAGVAGSAPVALALTNDSVVVSFSSFAASFSRASGLQTTTFLSPSGASEWTSVAITSSTREVLLLDASFTAVLSGQVLLRYALNGTRTGFLYLGVPQGLTALLLDASDVAYVTDGTRLWSLAFPSAAVLSYHTQVDPTHANTSIIAMAWSLQRELLLLDKTNARLCTLDPSSAAFLSAPLAAPGGSIALSLAVDVDGGVWLGYSSPAYGTGGASKYSANLTALLNSLNPSTTPGLPLWPPNLIGVVPYLGSYYAFSTVYALSLPSGAPNSFFLLNSAFQPAQQRWWYAGVSNYFYIDSVAVDGSGTFIGKTPVGTTPVYVFAFNASGNAVNRAVYSGSPNPRTWGYGLAVDPATNALYLANASSVIRTSSDASVAATQFVTSSPPLSTVVGLAVDAASSVYAVDAGNARVVKFDPQGRVQTTFSAGLRAPSRVAVDALMQVYVSDSGSVMKFNASGAPLGNLTTGPSLGPMTPVSMSVDAQGNLVVAEWNRVLVFPGASSWTPPATPSSSSSSSSSFSPSSPSPSSSSSSSSSSSRLASSSPSLTSSSLSSSPIASSSSSSARSASSSPLTSSSTPSSSSSPSTPLSSPSSSSSAVLPFAASTSYSSSFFSSPSVTSPPPSSTSSPSSPLTSSSSSFSAVRASAASSSSSLVSSTSAVISSASASTAVNQGGGSSATSLSSGAVAGVVVAVVASVLLLCAGLICLRRRSGRHKESDEVQLTTTGESSSAV